METECRPVRSGCLGGLDPTALRGCRPIGSTSLQKDLPGPRNHLEERHFSYAAQLTNLVLELKYPLPNLFQLPLLCVFPTIIIVAEIAYRVQRRLICVANCIRYAKPDVHV